MNNLGSVLKDVARYDEALVWLRKGADALSDNPAAHSNVLFTLVGYELEPAVERLAEAQRFAQRFGQHPFERWRDRIPDPNPQRRLKIGLFSPDFCRHAVSYFVEPLLEQWNRQTLEITLYACGEQFDDYSARLQAKADHWVNLHGVSDESCINQILQDEIDILVDLAGHTAGNRLAVFSAKAAPIQATYLGYYGTTGLPQVDYWVTDNVLHPKEQDRNDPCSEERWRLDRCYVSYRPLPTAPPVQAPPCLKTRSITFGSFNQSRKITPRTASHWMAVLNAIPNSKLLLKSKNLGEEVERQRVATLFEAMGLAAERLELRGHSPSLEEHLAAYNDVDIATDTFPYTGCTTTADALWMGVPVLTVAGESMVSRQAAAVLHGVDCAQWICNNEAEMVERAWLWPTTTTSYDNSGCSNANRSHRVNCSTMPALHQPGGAFRTGGCDGCKSKAGTPMPSQRPGPKPANRNINSTHTSQQQRDQTAAAMAGPYGRGAPTAGSTRRTGGCSPHLQPWAAVTLFAQKQPGEVLAWIETGLVQRASNGEESTHNGVGAQGPLAAR